VIYSQLGIVIITLHWTRVSCPSKG